MSQTKMKGSVEIVYTCVDHNLKTRSPIVFLEHLMDYEKHKLSFWESISKICELTLEAVPKGAIEYASDISDKTKKIMEN